MEKTRRCVMGTIALSRHLPLVVIATLGLCTQTARADTSASRWVLTSEASEPVRAVGQTLSDVLQANPQGISLQGDVARFKFSRENNPAFELLLTKNAMQEYNGRRLVTRHGVLHLPPSEESLDRQQLLSRVNAVAPVVPWRKAGLSRRPLTQTKPVTVDVKERSRLLSLRRRTLRLRKGEEAKKTYVHQESPISEALSNGNLPAVAICETCDPDLQSNDARARLRASRALLRTHPTEVRLWSLAADAALRLGLFNEAYAYADVATSMARPDALAFRTWNRLTGDSIDPTEDALALPRESDAAPQWPLIIFIFAGLAALLRTVSRDRMSARVQMGSVLFAAVATWAFFSTPAESPSPTRLDATLSRPDSLIAPLGGTACKASPPFHSTEGLEIFARCEDQPFSFHIRPLGDDELTVTEHHGLSVKGPNQSQATDQALRMLQNAVREAEKSGFRANPRAPASSEQTLYVPPRGSFERLEWCMSRCLVILATVIGLFFVFRCMRDLWSLRTSDRRVFIATMVLAAATLLLHVLVPDRLVMVYTGYDLTERMTMLEATPRYGAGGIWLYEPFFAVLGRDHASLQLANRVFGVLSFFPLAWLVVRFAPVRIAPWVMSIFVFLPLFWRDHTSEGIMAGCMWLMLSALAGWVAGLSARSEGYWMICALWMAAATSTIRPEAGPSLCLAAVGIWLLRAEFREQCSARLLAFFVIVYVGLTLGHGIWLIQSAQTQVEQASILGMNDAGSVLTSVLTEQNLLFDPSLFPIPWWIWVFAAFFAGSVAHRYGRLGVLLIVLAAFCWIAMSAVDLPTVSIPRVHLPALAFLVIPISLGSSFFARWRGANAVVVVIACVAGLVTAPKLLASSNAQEEESLIRIAAGEMKRPNSCLAIVDFSDPPTPGKTQRHFPSYLFPGSTVIGLSKYSEQENFCTGDKLALLGTRCFMTMRSSSEEDAPQDGELTVCREFRQNYRLEPVHVISVPNRRDFTFAMYPSRDELPIGVYRILEP